MIHNIFYYFIFTSAVLIYGIGINRATIICENPKNIFIYFFKMIITVCPSSVLTFIFVSKVLIPVNLVEMFPLIAILIFALISIFIEIIIRITAKTDAAELSVSFLFLLLAVNESNTILECFIISLICCAAFYAMIPFLYAVKKRIEISYPTLSLKNSSTIFISLTVLIIILLAYNASWLNPEVFN